MIAITWRDENSYEVESAGMRFIVDPWEILSASADLMLCTSAHRAHMDQAALLPLLESSPQAKIVLPKSAADDAHRLGVPYSRMTTTDAGLRVEFFKHGEYGRVYAVPSSKAYTPIGGYALLGYLVRFGVTTIYFPGRCEYYPELPDRLRPYNVTVLVASPSLTPAESADLAVDIDAQWLVAPATFAGFVDHMLGQRPEQRFNVLESGEPWTVPER